MGARGRHRADAADDDSSLRQEILQAIAIYSAWAQDLNRRTQPLPVQSAASDAPESVENGESIDDAAASEPTSPPPDTASSSVSHSVEQSAAPVTEDSSTRDPSPAEQPEDHPGKKDSSPSRAPGSKRPRNTFWRRCRWPLLIAVVSALMVTSAVFILRPSGRDASVEQAASSETPTGQADPDASASVPLHAAPTRGEGHRSPPPEEQRSAPPATDPDNSFTEPTTTPGDAIVVPGAPTADPYRGHPNPEAVFGRILLGPIDPVGYCAREGAEAGLRRPASGPRAAIDNWECRGGTAGDHLIVIDDLCRWQYGPAAMGAFYNPDDAFSWRCYR